MKRFSWYRKWRGGTWYKHRFTLAGLQLGFSSKVTWWARYGKLNRYSMVIDEETH